MVELTNTKNSLNIICAATPEFAIPSLSALASSSHRLIAVYTQPDRAAGRGFKLKSSAVKTWAIEHSIPVYQPENFKQPAAIQELAALQPDVLVVIAYGLILPPQVLSIPRWGCINVHASLLPRWRGASPIQQAILHGDSITGITIMQMDRGLDTGPILSKATCPVFDTDTSGSLHDRLAHLAIQPLLTTLNSLIFEQIQPQLQDERYVTYAAKINKADAAIMWAQPAYIICNQIRAFNPWPVTYTYVNDIVLKIHQASVIIDNTCHVPGTIINLDKKGMLVAAGENLLLVKRIQFPGGKIMDIKDALNANKPLLQVGQVFVSRRA